MLVCDITAPPVYRNAFLCSLLPVQLAAAPESQATRISTEGVFSFRYTSAPDIITILRGAICSKGPF